VRELPDLVFSRPAPDVQSGAGHVLDHDRANRIRTAEGARMSAQSFEELQRRKCVPCEGGIPKLSAAEAAAQVALLPGWRLTHDGQRIRKDWLVRDFASGIEFLRKVAEVAEEEWHHPDLHLEGFRNVWIEIWTHAIGGLSENDFILAARIEGLPVSLKAPS
jgi:4a-hydroxytetrahydrobiopterin dehydratase